MKVPKNMTKCCIEISSIFDSSIILMLHVLSANVMCRRPLQAGSFVNGTQHDAKVDCLIWHRDVVLQSSYVCFYLHNLYIYHFRKCADKNFIYFYIIYKFMCTFSQISRLVKMHWKYNNFNHRKNITRNNTVLQITKPCSRTTTLTINIKQCSSF